MPVAGLLLAAGAGRRMGGPKALVRGPGGVPLVTRATGVLTDAGCAPVVVVLGAAAEQARPLVPPGAEVAVATDWAEGMGASLRTGLAAVEATDAPAALVLLVDLLDVGPDVVRRVAGVLARSDDPARVLARATYGGVTGHPVLIGRAYWESLRDNAAGDKGARDLLASTPHLEVECGDLATGVDADTPDQLPDQLPDR